MTISKDWICGWLCGFFDGEGGAYLYSYRTRKGEARTASIVQAANTDIDLVQAARLGLAILGIEHACYDRPAGYGNCKLPYWTIRITGTEAIRRFQQLVGFASIRKALKLKEIMEWRDLPQGQKKLRTANGRFGRKNIGG